jgi:biopolymer transport protein ExbD
MKSSRRARRMARNHRRLRQQPRLNLVALMDIFTILVLFLMVNNGDVEVLQADRDIALPESLSEQRPEAALTIKITADDIRLDDQVIAQVDEVLAQDEQALAMLVSELNLRAAQAPALSAAQQEQGRQIIIMGDRVMPYEVLKRIMASCAGTDYRNISLAVNSVATPGELPSTDLVIDTKVAGL